MISFKNLQVNCSSYFLGVLHLQRSYHRVCGVPVRQLRLWQRSKETEGVWIGELFNLDRFQFLFLRCWFSLRVPLNFHLSTH